MYRFKVISDVLKVLSLSGLFAIVLTYFFTQFDLGIDTDIVRYAILGLFVLFIIIIFIVRMVFTNYQLIIKSSRVFVLGISLFLTTDMLTWNDKLIETITLSVLPILSVLLVITVAYINLYYRQVEKEIFDQAALKAGKIEIESNDPKGIEHALQESVAKWISPKYKGKISTLTEGFITHKKDGRQAIVSLFLMSDTGKDPKKLFELPINFN